MISKVTLQNIETLTEIDEQVYEEIIFFIVKKMISKQKSITAAESLTAGLFQAAIANVSGASNIFKGGFVTYSNQAKTDLLGITAEVISQNGVVSGQVAKEMANKARKKMNADFGVGLTGVAGPEKLEQQAVGTVFIGISSDKQVIAQKFLFAGNRKLVREKAVIAAFLLIESSL